MSDRNGFCRECGRPYGKHYASCSRWDRRMIDPNDNRLLDLEALRARLYDWASDPEFDPGGNVPYYGDAQMHVLQMLTEHVVDAGEWAEGKYRRERDPA